MQYSHPWDLGGKGDGEDGTHAGLALHGDSAARILNQALADVEAHASAFHVRVQALKQAKELALLYGTHAYAIVLNGEHHRARLRLGGLYLHDGGPVQCPVLERIAEQVVNDGAQVGR